MTVKLKDIYELFDVVMHIHVDGKFVANSIDIDSNVDLYNELFDKAVKGITVGDYEVAIDC